MQQFLGIFLIFVTCDLSLGYNDSGSLSSLLFIQNQRVSSISCTTDDDCQNFISGSICNKGSCKCPDKWILSSHKSECLKIPNEFGSPCIDNIQCSEMLSTGGACIKSQCKCKEGFHYLKGYCWKNLGLQQRCQKDEQCYASYEYIGLECKNNLCECRSEYYQRLNSGCRRKRKIGESCHLNSDCESKNCQIICTKSELIHNSTQESTDTIHIKKYFISKKDTELICPKGQFAHKNKCVLELGMKCINESECEHIPNATCLNSKCTCDPMITVASENNRLCLKVPPVPNMAIATCKEDAQCAVFGENSFCSSKCKCKNGTYFEEETKYCWTIKSLGEICSSDKDCYPLEKHMECSFFNSSKSCTCQKGYHPKNGNCIKDALNVGDFCENDAECQFPNSFCDLTSSSCACKKFYYIENKKCLPGVKTKCDEDKDCAHLPNVECKQYNSKIKQCLCLENYVSSEDYKYCLPAAQYGQNCTETFQCKHYLTELGICKNNTCQCSEETHYSYGKCYKNKYIGESCSSKLECLSGNDINSVICLKGYCACHYDYILNKKQVCVKNNSVLEAVNN